jgi:Fe-S cluster biogenesis protein NfuA
MRLFDVQGVEGVFLGQDFLTITKAQDADWSLLKPSILGAIMDHFTTGQAVITEDFELSDGHAEGDAADAEIITQIKELLDTHVRPAVANDGGDITFHGFKEGTVYLTMRGACSGCPSSTATLKHGIENLMRHYIPEVQQVEAVNG